jgi:hypothetical protein
VNDNLNPNYVTQQKLNLQDSFICSNIGVYISIPASAATSEGSVKLYSYPDETTFTAATASALNTLYSGFLSLTVNQRVIVPAWDLYRHFCAPLTQNGSPVNVAAGSAVDNSNNFAMDGTYNVEPNMVFVGSKKNQLQITIPQALTAIPTNARVCIIARGLLAQNSTPVR